jgi:Cu+-exporting ATPase
MAKTTTTTDNRDALKSLQFKIGGMSCSFCANAIERGLGREQGVDEVHVSLAHEEVLVRYRPDRIDATRIKDTLRTLGYLVRDPRQVGALDEHIDLKRTERNDLISAAVVAILMFLAMAAMWLDLWHMQNWHAWASWGLATYVFAWNGRRIIRMAWGAAWRGITNQHVLLAVGAIGAYIGGVLGVPIPFLDWYGFVGFPPVDFFGVVVFLTTYHVLSGYVALVVRTKASESVRRLLHMQPETARVVRNGREEDVPIDAVAVDDLVRIRPGDRIPVDGVVQDGASAVDQSIVTGEPIPEDKGVGDEVIGGSINHTGTLLVRVTRVGEDSFLRQIARHVEEARAMKPGIIVLVDRVLRSYVPAVLGIAAAALLFWGVAPLAWGDDMRWVTAIYAAVTVLVMGYPCALGMATPLALIRGGGMAAERGILMRSGEAFQVLKDVTHVVFDKTGTITQGTPTLMEIDALGDAEDTSLLRLAAAAERPSEHPLARAICEAAEDAGVDIPDAEDFNAMAGGGVEATVEGARIAIGTPGFLQSKAIDTALAAERLEQHEAQGRTTVLLAQDGSVLGILAIADAVKPDASDAIAALQERGMTPVMLSGDNRRTAEAVAADVGIEQVFAPVAPQDKAETIRELQQTGARVAMVGDGINDAPALMQAHVGIAIGAGTDIAIESSDVVVVGERVGAVPEAIAIGGMSYRKTIQNLWLAFVLNGVGVPIATTGLLHPSWAMAAMAASVTLVLANSFGGRVLQRTGRSAAPARVQGEPEPSEAGDSELSLVVSDMHCHGCVETIRAGLMLEDGVASVEGDPKEKLVHVWYRTSDIRPTDIETAIARLGYRIHKRDNA